MNSPRCRTVMNLMALVIGTTMLTSTGCDSHQDMENRIAALEAKRDAPQRGSARVFSVVDEKGGVRAQLTNADGMTWLSIFDAANVRRVAVSVSPDGTPALSMFDANDNRRVCLSVGKDGPSLVLLDENSKQRASIGVATVEGADGRTIAEPESSIRLMRSTGDVIWSAP